MLAPTLVEEASRVSPPVQPVVAASCTRQTAVICAASVSEPTLKKDPDDLAAVKALLLLTVSTEATTLLPPALYSSTVPSVPLGPVPAAPPNRRTDPPCPTEATVPPFPPSMVTW